MMNSHFGITVLTLVLLTYTVCTSPQAKIRRSQGPERGRQARVSDEPFCSPKEVQDRFCFERNSRKNGGCTPLMTAAERGQLDRVRELLATGAEVDARTSPTITALALAAGEGHLEVVKVLLRAGANPNIIGATFHGGAFAIWMSALNRCNKHWLEIFQAMLAQGVEINPTTDIYMSPIGVAIRKDDPVIIKALLAKGADVNLIDRETGETPLIFAARYSTPEVVNVLLDAGAQINAKDKMGNTALTAAIQNLDRYGMTSLLTARGAKH
jgi:ankyrin repeat protein